MAATYNIKIYQGDGYTLLFDVDGDYSAKTHTMAIAVGLESGTTFLTFATGGSGITATYNATTNKTTCTLTMTAVQTATFNAETIYFYDYEVSDGTGFNLTLLAGQVYITPQVTN